MCALPWIPEPRTYGVSKTTWVLTWNFVFRCTSHAQLAHCQGGPPGWQRVTGAAINKIINQCLCHSEKLGACSCLPRVLMGVILEGWVFSPHLTSLSLQQLSVALTTVTIKSDGSLFLEKAKAPFYGEGAGCNTCGSFHCCENLSMYLSSVSPFTNRGKVSLGFLGSFLEEALVFHKSRFLKLSRAKWAWGNCH